MNDRFKFRVWDEKAKKFYDSDFYVLCDGSGAIYTPADDEEILILEQCTGLKDKNGKLIYEGDWLKTKDGYYCFVVWFDGFWWVKSLPSEAMDLEYAEFYKECEVIGNIHENADLIKVGGK